MRYKYTPDTIWSSVEKTDSCWLGIGEIHRQGYIRVGYEGKRWLLHRLLWTLANGPIPDGLHVLHNCPGGDNPRCCNPSHMFLGTHTDNMHDARRKGSYDDNPSHGTYMSNAKLNDEKVREIRAKRASGVPDKKLAKEYGVAASLIFRIHHRQSWAHVI